MKCSCGNEARYVNADYEYCCALCPIKNGVDSIRLGDIPKLREWCVKYLDERPKPKAYREELRKLISTGVVGRGQLDSIETCAVLKLEWARKYLDEHRASKPHRDELRALIGRVPAMPLYEQLQLENNLAWAGSTFVNTRTMETFPAAAPLPFPGLSDEVRARAEEATKKYKTFAANATDKDVP